MTNEPPTGWVEPASRDGARDNPLVVFHLHRDCEPGFGSQTACVHRQGLQRPRVSTLRVLGVVTLVKN